jgi:hypothetical protein
VSSLAVWCPCASGKSGSDAAVHVHVLGQGVCVCVVCPCGVAHGQAGMQWQKHPKRRSMGRRMFFGRDPVTSMSPAVIHSIDHARTKMKSN